MTYANSDKVKVYKVYADDARDNEPYGVQTIIVKENSDHHNFEWFTTQEEQDTEYIRVIGEVSRGEWV